MVAIFSFAMQILNLNSIFCQLLKTINRVYAIIFFNSYRKNVTIKLSIIALIITLFLSILISLLILIENCYTVYWISGYSWMFNKDTCFGSIYLVFLNFVKISIVAATLIGDGII